MIATSRQGAVSGQNYLLLDYARRLAEHLDGRQAVHIRLSRLKAGNRREHHVTAAVSGLRSLVDSNDGQLFVLASADVVFVYRNAVHGRVLREVEQIRFLFGDDPALSGAGAEAFARWFEVESDYDGFLVAMRRLAMPAVASAEGDDTDPANTRARLKRRQSQGDPLTPDQLAKVEASLARADLSSLIRRQPVCRVSDRLDIEPVFEEVFVAIAGLRETVLPGTDLAGDRCLFKHLTETLDRRVLALLSAPDQARASLDQAINLNVATVLSADFVDFDGRLGFGGANGVIIEIGLIDALADLSAFALARDRLQGKGYRVCLDGVKLSDAPLVEVAALGVDLVKLRWDPALLGAEEGVHADIRSRIGRIDPETVILNQVDGRVGIDFGHGIGIGLFQGHGIDRLLADDKRRRHLLRLKQVLRADT